MCIRLTAALAASLAISSPAFADPPDNPDGIPVYNPDSGDTDYLDPDTPVYRVEPQGTTPFAPHQSDYHDPHDYQQPFGTYEATYLSTDEQILQDLREGQGYFEDGAEMHQSTLGDVMDQFGDDAQAHADYRFDATVVGDGDGRGIVISRPIPYEPGPDALPTPDWMLPDRPTEYLDEIVEHADDVPLPGPIDNIIDVIDGAANITDVIYDPTVAAELGLEALIGEIGLAPVAIPAGITIIWGGTTGTLALLATGQYYQLQEDIEEFDDILTAETAITYHAGNLPTSVIDTALEALDDIEEGERYLLDQDEITAQDEALEMVEEVLGLDPNMSAEDEYYVIEEYRNERR